MSIDPTAVVTVERVDWDDPSAVALRGAMRAEMRARYEDRLTQPAGIAADMPVAVDTVAFTGVAHADVAGVRTPVGHVALRWFDAEHTTVELKRMYVVAAYRGRGVSSALMRAAEDAAARAGARRIVLQTGDRQPDAVHVYERAGYTPIPIFPPYEALTYSHCFAKNVSGAGGDQPLPQRAHRAP